MERFNSLTKDKCNKPEKSDKMKTKPSKGGLWCRTPRLKVWWCSLVGNFNLELRFKCSYKESTKEKTKTETKNPQSIIKSKTGTCKLRKAGLNETYLGFRSRALWGSKCHFIVLCGSVRGGFMWKLLLPVCSITDRKSPWCLGEKPFIWGTETENKLKLMVTAFLKILLSYLYKE